MRVFESPERALAAPHTDVGSVDVSRVNTFSMLEGARREGHRALMPMCRFGRWATENIGHHPLRVGKQCKGSRLKDRLILLNGRLHRGNGGTHLLDKNIRRRMNARLNGMTEMRIPP
ncbi:hypothetical protein PSUB009319_24740 [Ralstonia sp. SET104]|nr:hypothetical protein PSUB009319_24740 [Ralstonia sp. SET104]